MSRSSQSRSARERIAQAFTMVEDVLYVGLGVVLAAGGAALLANAAVYFPRSLLGGAIGASVVAVLDQLLLILMMDQGESAFRYARIELGLLTVMTGVLVTCLVGLRKRDKEAVAERA
jgi:hypothetical protein